MVKAGFRFQFILKKVVAMDIGVSVRLLRGMSASAVVAVGLALAGPAQAVEFIGFTDGCFGSGCTPTSSSLASTITLAGTGLSFTNSTFNVTSSGGFAAIGGAPATPNFNNLGSFTVTNATSSFNNDDFSLLVSFSAPAGVSPTSTTFVDLVTGSVTSGVGGAVNVKFDTPPQAFTFDGGAFTLSVNDVSLTALGDASNSIAVSGLITIQAVPEASTWAMMIFGFASVGFLAYRRQGRSLRLV
jgi:hypothetical protein